MLHLRMLRFKAYLIPPNITLLLFQNFERMIIERHYNFATKETTYDRQPFLTYIQECISKAFLFLFFIEKNKIITI